MKMTNLYRLGALALAVAMMSACEEPKLRAPEAVAPSATPTEAPIIDLSGAEMPSQRTRQIDWTAARQARIQAIEAGHTADTVLAQASGNASISPVPVMLPSGIVMPANAKQTVAFTPDGYFASYPGAKYDIIVNGTNEVFDTSAMDADEIERSEMKFDVMEAGAQVAFSRFGADYLVEFECNILDGDTGCITEEEAIAVVNGLFVAVAE
ncbi:hypothetical protein [Hirschia litorea]|uniref:Lipoprotein n=1 Tax=Hirschia litorea TaxID=1199156 RepID=A0ABW2IM76_9PROT